MIVYGIKACDTCRKALKALRAAGHEVAFHDVRDQPLTPAQIAQFIEKFGERVVNRSSTTWRNLPDGKSGAPIADLLAAHPALMKRPVIEAGGTLHLGWTPEVQAAVLN